MGSMTGTIVRKRGLRPRSMDLRANQRSPNSSLRAWRVTQRGLKAMYGCMYILTDVPTNEHNFAPFYRTDFSSFYRSRQG